MAQLGRDASFFGRILESGSHQQSLNWIVDGADSSEDPLPLMRAAITWPVWRAPAFPVDSYFNCDVILLLPQQEVGKPL